MEYDMHLSQVRMSCDIHVSCLQVLCRTGAPGLYKHKRQIISIVMTPVRQYTSQPASFTTKERDSGCHYVDVCVALFLN